MLDKILKSLIYTIIFLVPIFFLPFTYEFLEFNKMYLLFFLVWLAILLWFSKMIIKDKTIRIKHSKIDYILLGFIGLSIISTIFSVDSISSLFGYYGRFSTGLITLITFAGFYFLIKNQELNIEKIIKTLLVSTGIILIFPYLRLFGFWRLFTSPFVLNNLALRVSTLGATLEALAMYLVVMMFLGIVVSIGGMKWFVKKDIDKKWKIYSGIIVFLSLILLIIADFTYAWIVIGISSLLLVLLSLKTKILKGDVHKLIIPIALIILSVLFLIFNVRPLTMSIIGTGTDGYYSFMSEKTLSQAESWSVGFRSATSNIKQAVVGTGPGNFYYSFSQFRPESLNKGDLWAVRFDRSNVFAETLATTGILGILLYVAFLFTAISYRDKKKANILLIILLSLILIQLFYYQAISLSLLFWLFLGIFVSAFKEKVWEVQIKESMEHGLFTETALIILCLVYIVAGFYLVKFYVADVHYVQALNNPNLDQKIVHLQKSIKLNPLQSRYQLVLSKVFLTKAQEGETEEEVTQNIALARLFALNASELTPNQIGAWQSLSEIYQNAASISKDSEEFINLAIEALNRSIKIEPKNPQLYTELGSMYLLLDDEDMAVEYFNKAIEQKSNYDQAHINLALLMEADGDTDEAIEKLEWLFGVNPSSVETSFQLGRLYYNEDRLEEAVTQLGVALRINPNYSNALYALALALEKQGKITESVEVLEAVLMLNPDKTEIEDRIQRIKFGESVEETEESLD